MQNLNRREFLKLGLKATVVTAVVALKPSLLLSKPKQAQEEGIVQTIIGPGLKHGDIITIEGVDGEFRVRDSDEMLGQLILEDMKKSLAKAAESSYKTRMKTLPKG